LTGWTDNRAMVNKKAKSVRNAMNSIEQLLPFKIKSIQTDCGTVFLSYLMMKYFQHRPAPRDAKEHNNVCNPHLFDLDALPYEFTQFLL